MDCNLVIGVEGCEKINKKLRFSAILTPPHWLKYFSHKIKTKQKMTETKPLKDFSELLNYQQLPEAQTKKASKRGPKFKLSREDGVKIELIKNNEKVPKTLVCHDMKGGYLEDRFTNGAKDLLSEPYVFTHWSKIDIFVYFSHHFITIPPIGWIEAAHKNGVQILGTVITELEPGEKIWNEILRTPENQNQFVQKLTEIAKNVGFDGWLLNIENKIDKSKIPDLIKIVEDLTKAMHDSDPDSLVIWYDSVTIEGDLKWQNSLNDLNSAFFDVCDGIFLNYTWTEELLANSVLFDPIRRFDVYVGLDVFGRGCPGGGGFDSNQALTMINYAQLSCAIFAPGWTHECANAGDFRDRDVKFWSLLEPLLHHQGVVQAGPSLELNLGSGLDGNAGDKWWLDLSKQSISPSFKNEIICDFDLKANSIIKAIFDSPVKDQVVIVILDDKTFKPKFQVDKNTLILNLENESNCTMRFLKFDQGSGTANAEDKCSAKLLKIYIE